MARFSIVVPMNEIGSHFEETLATVLRYRPDQCQVIVVHEGAYDDPYGLAKEVDFVPVSEVPARKSESGQSSESLLIAMFNAGVKAARGNFVGFLRPSVQLTEHWEIPIWKAFVDPEVGIVSPALIDSKSPNRVVTSGVEAGSTLQRRLTGKEKRIGVSNTKGNPIGATSWGGFYRKSILNAIGEVDQTLESNYWDLDLALSFQALNLKTVYTEECRLILESGTRILEEENEPHGCSAQRGLTRFAGLVKGISNSSPLWDGIKEFLVRPWSLAPLKHAQQRIKAATFTEFDRHYRELLEVLLKQRSRLVASGLHSRVAAHERAIGSSEQRRAA